MNKKWLGIWIMDPEFKTLEPINVFHKELQIIQKLEHRTDLKNHHMLLRKKFTYDKNIKKAILELSADDYYKLYINDQFVSQGPAPAYYDRYNYNRLDVTDYLHQGENIIAVHVYYQGLINRVWNSGDYRQGFIGELAINDTLTLISDSSWKYSIAKEYFSTQTIGYDTQFLEDMDFRLKKQGWYTLDYDDTSWSYAAEHPEDDHTFQLQPTPNLAVYRLKPVYTIEKTPGHYFLDFGHELTGQFQFCTQGIEGQLVEVFCGEELMKGRTDSVRFELRCNCTYHEKMILSGKNDVSEYYDYKAFRFVEVIAPEHVIEPESFAAIVRHYPLDESRSFFQSSNGLLDDIWTLCKTTLKYGSQEVYVDCPNREKGQYLGDATITAPAHLYISGDNRLYKKALLDFAQSTRICPGMMAVAPGSLMQEIADYSLQWPLQLLTYYMHTGDYEFLQRIYPVAEGIVTYFQRYERTDGLLENIKDKWNLVDWPENLRDGYDFNLSKIVGDGCHNVINAFYCGCIKTLNQIRNILQIGYEDKFPALKESYIKAFYRENLKLFADSTTSNHTSLHSNTIPLFFGLNPDSSTASIVELIRSNRLNCGVYNSYFLLKGLANVGEYNLMYELLTGEDEHSWANMLCEGATTCFEAWGKEQKWNTSLCHPWASAPVLILIEDIIGLSPAKPGWSEISFTPHIPSSIKQLSFQFHTIHNKINVDYQDGIASFKVSTVSI